MLLAAGAALVALAAAHVHAAETPIKIALIADKTGPLEAYAKQTVGRLRHGPRLRHRRHMEVAGHKLMVIEKDSQTKPDVGRNLLNEAYNDDGADIAVGGTSSAVALAMLPVAQDNKKIFIVEPAVADSITGDKWNRYIFRTGRNRPRTRSQCAGHRQARHGRWRRWPRITRSAAISSPHSARAGARPAPSSCSRNMRRRPRPTSPRRISASSMRSPRSRAARSSFVNWAGGGNPLAALKALEPERRDRGLDRRQHPAGARRLQGFPGLEGAAYYYYEIPKNPVNDWLVAENKKRFNGAPPDFFTAAASSPRRGRGRR